MRKLHKEFSAWYGGDPVWRSRDWPMIETGSPAACSIASGSKEELWCMSAHDW